jgi:hypothetical protein
MNEELRRTTACSTPLTAKAFGLNWILIYKEYYALGGSIAAVSGLWLVDRRSDSKEGNKRKQSCITDSSSIIIDPFHHLPYITASKKCM